MKKINSSGKKLRSKIWQKNTTLLLKRCAHPKRLSRIKSEPPQLPTEVFWTKSTSLRRNTWKWRAKSLRPQLKMEKKLRLLLILPLKLSKSWNLRKLKILCPSTTSMSLPKAGLLQPTRQDRAGQSSPPSENAIQICLLWTQTFSMKLVKLKVLQSMALERRTFCRARRSFWNKIWRIKRRL